MNSGAHHLDDLIYKEKSLVKQNRGTIPCACSCLLLIIHMANSHGQLEFL